MANCTNGGPLGTWYAVSSKGWMTIPAYIDWFRNLFIPSLPDERLIFLILDGHSSLIWFEVRQLAIDNGVHFTDECTVQLETQALGIVFFERLCDICQALCSLSIVFIDHLSDICWHCFSFSFVGLHLHHSYSFSHCSDQLYF